MVLRRWLGLRRRAAGPEPKPAASGAVWDVVIDLDPGDLPAGAGAQAAAAAVRAAVQLLPGAGWVSVEVHGLPRATTVRVFAAGTGVEPQEEPWPARQATVAAAIRQALAATGLPATSVASTSAAQADRSPPGGAPDRSEPPAFAEPSTMASGFSEAPLAQLAALRDLAALASLSRPVPAPAPAGRQPAAKPDDAGLPLLARLLGFVLPGDGRHEAEAALQRFGTFAGVLAAPESELREVAGLGTHSIAAIKLVHAAALRLARSRVSAMPVLDSRDRLYAYLSAVIARERIEQFRILFLDGRGMLRADEVQGTGTVNHTPVYPREVVRRALELQAAAVVLVHNHPSGDPTPSQDDIEMTARVQDAARALSIEVRDHVIVGAGRWVSLAESGLM